MNSTQQMQLLKNISNKITDLCNEKGISTSELCNVSGITESMLNDIIQLKDTNPEIEILLQICKALGVTLSEFFFLADV